MTTLGERSRELFGARWSCWVAGDANCVCLIHPDDEMASIQVVHETKDQAIALAERIAIALDGDGPDPD